MKAVILSRAVQNGANGCLQLMKHALPAVDKGRMWNLSYVDDPYFDRDMIAAIYDFLIAECDSVVPMGGIYQSRYNFVHAGRAVVNGLRSRFVREKADALNLL